MCTGSLLAQQCPEGLRCPITNMLMNEPVMAADGFTYDRAAITDWIEFHRTSPKTGAQISPRLFPNIEKKFQVDQWRSSQPTPTPMEAILSNIAWANSSQDVCNGLLNLSALVAQKEVLVPAQQMRRMRLCLSADETIWCRQVQQLLDGRRCFSRPPMPSLLPRPPMPSLLLLLLQLGPASISAILSKMVLLIDTHL